LAIVFDIDGTLLTGGGAGAMAWGRAFEEQYGVPANIDYSRMADMSAARNVCT
jgi:beta-phosphoglucomutase-like phosphatase (HAD superfamily)